MLESTLKTIVKRPLTHHILSLGRDVMAKHLPSLPISIKVSPAEVSKKRLTWKNLELATRALHRDGLVVLEDMIDHSELDFLNKKMVDDALVLQSAGENSPYNYNRGNIQQDPPAIKRYFNPSIFLNPLATQLTSTLLGPLPRLSFLSANSALPPSASTLPQAQPTHSDADFNHPSCPFALVVNVPLITMTPDNGSTEVWLGTHLFTQEVQEGKHGERASGRIRKEFLKERREVRPPCQPVVKKGSVVVRDLRLWHGGMPNFSREVRVMLAMIHFAPWYRNAMQVEFAEDLKEVLEVEGKGLQVQGTFLPEEEVLDRYLKRGYGNAYDFDQVDKWDVDI